MSVNISSIVWSSSFDTPLQKLILLSLADMANDEGYCWPSVRSIRTRVGVSDGAIRDNIRLLEAMGWIRREARMDKGRQTSNGYWVSPSQPTAPATPPYRHADTQPTAPATPLNHHTITSDPSSSPPPSSGRPPDPPASEEDQLAFTPAAIKNLWNETCPSMPQVTEVTATRFRHLKARSGLKLDKLKQVFEMVEESDFLTGRIGGPKPWATLDWLIKPNNWAKVQEGNYRPRKGESVVDKKPLKEYF